MPLVRAADDLDVVLEQLLQFYKNPTYSFGRNLRYALHLDSAVEITTEHVRQYYAENDDFGTADPNDPDIRIVHHEMLERALNTLKIEVIIVNLQKTGAVEELGNISQQITKALAAKLEILDEAALEALGITDVRAYVRTMFPVTLTGENLRYRLIDFLDASRVGEFKAVLTNDEVAALFTSIMTNLDLVKRALPTTVQVALEAVQKPAIKPADVTSKVDLVVEHLLQRMEGTHTAAIDAAYQKANRERPNRILEELDFVGHEVTHKDLLLSKLRKLKDKSPEDAERFCGAIRKLLLAPKTANPIEQSRLNAKIKFALGKLCQVLRKYDLNVDADTIEAQVFNRDYVGQFAKIKEEELALPGVKDKLKSAMAGINEFVSKFILRSDALTAQEVAAVPGNVANSVTKFVSAAEQYPDYVRASRKLVNKCHRLARILNEIAIERATQNELDRCGVRLAATDPLNNLPARDFTHSFALYQEKHAELLARTAVAADLAPGAVLAAKAYLPEQELKSVRDSEISRIYNAAELLSAQLLVAKTEQNTKVIGPLWERLQKLCDNLTKARATAGREQLTAIEKGNAELEQCQKLVDVFIPPVSAAERPDATRTMPHAGFPFPWPRT